VLPPGAALAQTTCRALDSLQRGPLELQWGVRLVAEAEACSEGCQQHRLVHDQGLGRHAAMQCTAGVLHSRLVNIQQA
jgi:hypothetical protein